LGCILMMKEEHSIPSNGAGKEIQYIHLVEGKDHLQSMLRQENSVVDVLNIESCTGFTVANYVHSCIF
jgi:hypothetical protein